jgi:acetyl esterase
MPHEFLDPRVRAFLDTFNRLPRPSSVAEARERERMMQSDSTAPATVDIDDRDLMTTAGSIPVRIVRPAQSDCRLPAIVYLHGGGWIVGDRFTHDRLIRTIAARADAAVVFVEYSRAPEAIYPVAVEQCYAVVAWIAEYGSTLNLDGTAIAIAGDSAGGNLATVVAMVASLRGGPRLACQALLCPATDAAMDTNSFDRFADGYFLSRAGLEQSWGAYAPERSVRLSAGVSPLRASADQIRGLPPTLIITAELDPLRDEGEAFARKLMAAGIPVAAQRYIGTIHAFVLINALARTPSAQAAVDQAIAYLKHHLELPTFRGEPDAKEPAV